MQDIYIIYHNIFTLILNIQYKYILAVTDLISQLVQVLRREMAQLRVSVQELEELEPVEPWDEG